ncbi:bifunctional folylpolyglutamate synthase/dihydrofolate synthase [Lacticaseibacillus sp. GG6-2]
MDYQTAVTFIHALPRLAKDGSQDRINALLAALAHPEAKQVYIHVTGTNGKGSVANVTAHILEAAGLHVGLFTSPFIMRFNERFMIDHQPIPDVTLAALTTRVATALAGIQAKQPEFVVTEFEFVTALGLLYFHDANVDVAVIEVGIGGKEDSTNVIMPQVAVITSVGLDHQALLGNTIQSIATHKAGIIKPNVPVVTGALPQAATTVVAARVAVTHSVWDAYPKALAATHARVFDWGQTFDYQDADGWLKDVTIPLMGDYQPANMAVAIRTAKRFAIGAGLVLDDAMIKAGLAASTWPGRMEKISRDPLIILDGAHNPQGVGGLVKTLAELFPNRSVTVMAGVLKDKDVNTMVTELVGSTHRLWLVPVPNTPRATAAKDYPANVRHFADWQTALAAYRQDHADEPLVITGSLYLVAAVRQALM